MPSSSQYVVMDKTGFPWGPFSTAHVAGMWADKRWPGGESPEPMEEGGWFVVPLRHPVRDIAMSPQ